eukprot:1724038-Prymnesium_polylepis.1
MGATCGDHVEDHMRGHVGVTRLHGRADGEARVAHVEAVVAVAARRHKLGGQRHARLQHRVTW